MHASNPPALQNPNATVALKEAIAIGLTGVSSGMVEVSVLYTSIRRLVAMTVPAGGPSPSSRRLAITPGALTAEYRIVLPPDSSGYNATQVAHTIVQTIVSEPIKLAFRIQTAILAANIPTMVTNTQVLTPLVDMISDNACVFRYWRFMPVKARGSTKWEISGIALGDLTLYDAGMNNISVSQANIDVSASPAFDNDATTSWVNGALLPLHLDFKVPKGIDFYRWTTANVASPQDPMRWRLEASSDNIAWKVVDERAVVDHQTPILRRIPAGLFKVGCSGDHPWVIAAGATDSTDGLSPLAIIVLVVCALIACAISSGCYVFWANRGCPKMSRVSPEEGIVAYKEDNGPDTVSPIVAAAGWPSSDVGQAAPNQEIQGLLALEQTPASDWKPDWNRPETPDAAAPAGELFPPPAIEDDRFFRKGSRVVIAGLTNTAVVENNGAVAEIIRYDPDLAKYLVRLEGSKRKVTLKPQNVILAVQPAALTFPSGAAPPPREPWLEDGPDAMSETDCAKLIHDLAPSNSFAPVARGAPVAANVPDAFGGAPPPWAPPPAAAPQEAFDGGNRIDWDSVPIRVDHNHGEFLKSSNRYG